MRILVAEDEFTARTLLTGLLGPLGTCDVAVDGKEAVFAVERAIAEGQPYDLICLDIGMPGLDGKEALRAIREIERGHDLFVGAGAATIVMTTAQNGADTIMSSFADQADGYIVKPVEEHSLMGTLADLGLIDPGSG